MATKDCIRRPIRRASCDSNLSSHDTHIELVPATGRNACGGVTDEISMPKLFENSKQNPAEIYCRVHLEYVAAGQHTKIAKKPRLTAYRHGVHDSVGLLSGIEHGLRRQPT